MQRTLAHLQRAILIAGCASLWLASAQNGLTIAPSVLPYGSVGNGYSAAIFSNGGPKSAWTTAGGALPPGLSIGSVGSTTSVTGTPSTPGSYSFTLKVTDPDRDNASTTQGFSITVAQIGPSSPLPTASLNVPYSVTFTISPAGTYSWQSPNPPPGLAMSPQGVLSGTPNTTGTFNFLVSATPPTGVAAGGPTVSASYQLTVVPGLAFTSSVILPNGVAGTNYNFLLAAIGGTQPYTFTLEPSGAILNELPANLALSVGGTISGIPTTAGNYGFAIDVTDANKITASAFFQLIVAPPLIISTPSPLPTASLQSAYSQTIAATGGNLPISFSLVKGSGALPAGLALQSNGSFSGTPTAAGTSTFTVQATDNAGYSVTKQFQLTVAPAGALLQASPLLLTFTGAAGDTDSPPTPQIVSIIAPSGAPANFSAAIQGTAPWLKISPASGSAPAALTVSVSSITGTTTLAPGPYTATILISVPGNAGQTPISVQVNFTVTAGKPPIQVAPTLLSFFARTAAPSVQEQTIVIEDSGGGGAMTATVVGSSSWITLPKSGGLSARVDVNTQGLDTGNYHDIVRLTNQAGSLDVPVTLFAAAPGPVMALGVTGLRFPSRQGSGTTEAQTFNVLNLGDSTSTVNYTISLMTGGNWLSIAAPGSGTSTPSQPGVVTLVPLASTANLPAGPQYALISVADPQSQNSPQYLMAVLDNEPGSSPALPDPLPAGLYFTSSTGAQVVLVNTSSATPVPFQTSAVTADGANWLAVSPASGNASAANPGQLSITAASGAVSGPGIYHGSVNIAMNNVLREVNVTMVVTPSGTVNATFQPRAAGSCTPSHIAITQTGLVNNFAVPAGWPASLIVQLNDDCGNPVSNGSVVASFSNGDPPLSLPGDHTTNIYSSTWQPGTTFPEMTVTVQAAAGTLPQAVQQFTGSVGANSNTPPSLAPNGALNIFFDNPTANAAGRALAPGGVIQVYGTGLSSALTSPGVVPLFNQISGTYMLIGQYQVPLFFVAPGVLAAQVPFELTPNQQYPAIVSVNNALTLPQKLPISPLQPGVLFNIPDGTVVAQRPGDGSLISASNRAKPGEVLTIYLAGMGPTDPAVPSGAPTPLQKVLDTQQPTVTLGGESVNVGYAGLTPTGIGLYQINFTVPLDAQPGLLDLVIVQGTTPANATKLYVGGQ